MTKVYLHVEFALNEGFYSNQSKSSIQARLPTMFALQWPYKIIADSYLDT